MSRGDAGAYAGAFGRLPWTRLGDRFGEIQVLRRYENGLARYNCFEINHINCLTW